MILPPDVAALVDALIAGSQEALGDNLVGVYLCGSLALGDFDPEKSDVDALVVCVRDEGVGIPTHEQSRVFQRFFRGSALADTVKGTGLGLAIVEHAVQGHGGTVTLASEEGRGTTVTVRLPLDGPESA